MKLNFDIWIRNKETDSELIIKDNCIDSDSYRCKYNCNSKYIENTDYNNYKTMFNSFKKEFSKSFNLILTDDSKIYTNHKKLAIESLENSKCCIFESYSNKYGFNVAPCGYFDKFSDIGVEIIK